MSYQQVFPQLVRTVQDILKINDERFKVVSASSSGNEGNDQSVQVIRDFHQTDPAAHSAGVDIFKIDLSNEFLHGLVSTAQAYEEGQVIVSTGRFDASKDLSSGYILMNANPSDISTPHIDIVERTGSGVYDLSLKTRIGDLSGLSSAYLYGDEEPGFGIYTENGFFKGTLHAMTGSIHGILNVATIAGGIETNQKIKIGRDVDGSNDGIYVNNNNYWFTDGSWKVGGGTNYLKLDSATAGNIDIKAQSFDLQAGNLTVVGSGASSYIKMGSLANASTTSTTNSGFYADNNGNVLIKGNVSANNYVKITGAGGIDIKSTTFDLLAGSGVSGQV